MLASCSGWTEIFIYPGYRFKVLDGLITNFHLPESTLLMLVSALAGREHILNAYAAGGAAGAGQQPDNSGDDVVDGDFREL